MKCEWIPLLSILPKSIQADVNKIGKTKLQELRLRVNHPPELVFGEVNMFLDGMMHSDDLEHIINRATNYSPWAASTISKGYITIQGGHRIGICGNAVVQDGRMTAMRSITSLCIRIARDYTGIAHGLETITESILIIGQPGSGKTTLLRDLIRLRSEKECVAVVDERQELFPEGFSAGSRTDVMSGCPKVQGIDTVLRTMGPATVAIDEITATEDCKALLQAGWCGVSLLATAHAGTRQDLFSRPVYRPVVEAGLFQYLVILHSDKTWTVERMTS